MPRAAQRPVRALTLFLIKEGVSRDSVLDIGRRTAARTRVALADSVESELLTYSTPNRHPAWVDLFAAAIDPRHLELWSCSASAALIVEISDRLFVLTFGYARHIVRPDTIEGNFGLRVALNAIQEDSIRSIDRKTFEGVTTHVREQASKTTKMSLFGINADRDLLRAVVGTPQDETLGKRIVGMDSLSLSIPVDLSDLPNLLNRLLESASDNAYREKYPWIDNVTELRDPSLIGQLQSSLVGQLIQSDLDRKWLAVPDLLDWEDIGGFRYGCSDSSELFDDISFSDYLATVQRLPELTWERLSRGRVRCFSASSSQAIHDWPLTYCIYAEVMHEDGLYLLSGGEWFKLDTGYVQRVDRDIDTIPATMHALPRYRLGESEPAYNVRLAAALPGAAVMDANVVPYGGGRSSIEFCDVIGADKRLYHVKRYRASSVLSHLFAQGLVSGTALISDQDFRQRLNEQLPPNHRLTDIHSKPNAPDYEVAYVIASKYAGELVLPFFSRITLRNARNTLQALGFNVSLTKVRIE